MFMLLSELIKIISFVCSIIVNFAHKAKFRNASNHYKRDLEATKLAYANK